MAKKSALGRGLGALLPVEPREGQDIIEASLETRSSKTSANGVSTGIDLSLISPNPYQPRKDFDPEELEELTASITQLGIIQPITVRKSKEGYELISGERRLKASKKAGLKTIPAYVIKVSDQEMIEMAVVENVQRADLNPIEIARAYQRLMEECNLTQEKVADRVGKNRSTVTNTLRLLSLDTEVQNSLIEGKISAGHARVLVTLVAEKQKDLLNRILRRGLSVRDTEALGKVLAESDTTAKPYRKIEKISMNRDELELLAITDKLRSGLATQVKVNHKSSGKGVIEIEYYDVEDLERITDKILK